MSSRIIRGDKQLQNVNFGQINATRIIGNPVNGGDDLSNDGSADFVDDTITQAELIVKEAVAKAAAIAEEAKQSGYREGLELARREVTDAVSLIQSVAKTVLEKKWGLIGDVEDDIVSLAVEIAEKIVSEQLKVSSDVVLSITRKALMMAADRENLVIRINPDDLDVVKSGKEDIMSSMDGIRGIEIIADRRIGRGGCILETGVGNVDARIHSQLDQAEKTMRGVVSHE